jgi:hypothetical protein
MAVSLTEAEFSKHLNTKFQFKRDGQESLDLELVEVKGYPSSPSEHAGMERFSAFFNGPTEPRLPQGTYSLQHDQMGDFDIFIVPIGPADDGVHYEAVFNYFKEESAEY